MIEGGLRIDVLDDKARVQIRPLAPNIILSADGIVRLAQALLPREAMQPPIAEDAPLQYNGQEIGIFGDPTYWVRYLPDPQLIVLQLRSFGGWLSYGFLPAEVPRLMQNLQGQVDRHSPQDQSLPPA